MGWFKRRRAASTGSDPLQMMLGGVHQAVSGEAAMQRVPYLMELVAQNADTPQHGIEVTDLIVDIPYDVSPADAAAGAMRFAQLEGGRGRALRAAEAGGGDPYAATMPREQVRALLHACPDEDRSPEVQRRLEDLGGA